MVSEFGGLDADGTSFENSGFSDGVLVDSSDAFERIVVEKSTSGVLVERDKSRRGAMG